MTRTVTLFFLLLFAMHGFSQTSKIQRILNLPRTKIDQIRPEKSKNALILPSGFSQDLVNQSRDKAEGNIEKVYYIYTGYAQNPSFNQQQLDEKRMTKLGSLFPEVFSNPYIQWEIIEQTGCQSPSDGDNFFHGFVVQFRPTPSEADRAEEISRIQAFLKNPEAGFESPDKNPIEDQIHSDPEVLEDGPATFPGGEFALFNYLRDSLRGGGKLALNRDDIWVKLKLKVAADGSLSSPEFLGEYPDYVTDDVDRLFNEMPDWKPEMKNGQAAASEVNLEIRVCFSPIVRGMYYRDGKKPEFDRAQVEAFQKNQQALPDEEQERINKTEKSSIYRGLDMIASREKVAAVMDVTSSMSSHIVALTWWISNSKDSLNIVHYTFFNDGDNRPDGSKKVGKTGGIYHGDTLFFYTQILMQAMQNGTGGDLEENDLEAVLEAQSKAPEASSIVLIADNFSDVRDLSLLDRITKKVHVLIGGKVTAVRECYLDIAKATGGDIIVNGNRISLENIHAGSQITIAETTYAFDGKNFRIL